MVAKSLAIQAAKKGAAKGAAAAARKAKKKAALAEDVLQEAKKPTSGDRRVRPAEVAFDVRIEPRKRERPKVDDMEISLSARRSPPPEDLSVFDLEGRPFITSMSDMSAAGDAVTAVNDVDLAVPVRRMGGQDFMFDDPDAVWAADLSNAAAHLELARALRKDTGQDPLFLPWAMSPTSIDFAHMPRELMLRYASANMPKGTQRRLTKDIKAILPEFKALDDPASAEVFREAVGKKRGALNRVLDQYRDSGGLGMGSARLAMTDLEQLGMPLTSLRNVGSISALSELEPSRHPSYRTALPGEGVGRLREPIGALDLLPAIMRDADLTDPFGFPVGVVEGVKSPLRALQMKPKGGVISYDVLRTIENRLKLAEGD
jgi:hypothetical protein